MPKRIVDGEAVWTSRKLKSIPEQYRFHYANWIPMADVNGTFEADPDTIWAKIYAFLQPGTPVQAVQEILRTFVAAGLVRVWRDGEKLLGYFDGIEKPGRLPSEEHKKRYKKSLSEVPTGNAGKFISANDLFTQDNSGKYPVGFGIGLGSGLVEVGVEGASPVEEEMAIQKQIKKLSLRILGCEAEPWDDVWSRIKDLAEAFGSTEVESAFEEWATARQGDVVDRPVAEFLKTATGILRGTILLKGNPEVKTLIYDLAKISNGTVLFDTKQSAGIGRLLSDYSAEDVKSSFRQFFSTRDDWQLKKAAKDFSEQADQLLFVHKKVREENKQQEELKNRLMAEQREQAEAELASNQQNRVDEVSMDLPD